MSDAFNPQELLTKLRAKSSNSTAASGSLSMSQEPQRRYSGAEAEQKSIGANRVQATATIRTPISLTLTPSQRQENLNARLELEKEIKRLQDEVTNLVSENMQLKRDKEDVEQQFIEFKVKSEDTITKLRGKIAAMMRNSADGQPDRGAGAGRLYGQRSNEGPNKLYNSNTRSPNSKSAQKHFGTPHSEPPPPPPPLPQGGFRDPTFSELMRRSTPEHHDFRDALRRNGSTKLGTGLAANPLAASHPPSGGSTTAHHHSIHHSGGVHSSGVHGSGGSMSGAHASNHYHGGQGINPALVHGGVGTPNANIPAQNNAPRSKSFSGASGGGSGGHLHNGQYLFSDAPPGSESKQLGINSAGSGSGMAHGDSGHHRAGPGSSLVEMESFMAANASHTHAQQQNAQSSGPSGSGGPTKQPPPPNNAGPFEHMGGMHGHHHHHQGGYNAPRGVDDGGSYSDSDDLPVLEIDLSN